MSSHSNAEALARVKKAFSERQGNVIHLENDDEVLLFKQRVSPRGAIVVNISISTCFCCGLGYDADLKRLVPCLERTKKDFGFAFCSREHQKEFERGTDKHGIQFFYDIVGVVNTSRPELADKFYSDYLPFRQIHVATVAKKDIVFFLPGDRGIATASTIEGGPIKSLKEFQQSLKPDLQRFAQSTTFAVATGIASASAEFVKEEDVYSHPIKVAVAIFK
jgi:hypothetical protein